MWGMRALAELTRSPDSGSWPQAIIVDYSRGRPPFLSHQSLWKLMATNLGSTGHNVTVCLTKFSKRSR